MHHCDRNYQCETCGRAFLFETNFIRHQQVCLLLSGCHSSCLEVIHPCRHLQKVPSYIYSASLNVQETRNTFGGMWYLLHSHVDNEWTLGGVVRYWPLTNSFFLFRGSYVCANFGENRSRNATVRVLTDGQTHWQTQTDSIICPRLYAIAMGQIIIRMMLHNKVKKYVNSEMPVGISASSYVYRIDCKRLWAGATVEDCFVLLGVATEKLCCIL